MSSYDVFLIILGGVLAVAVKLTWKRNLSLGPTRLNRILRLTLLYLGLPCLLFILTLPLPGVLRLLLSVGALFFLRVSVENTRRHRLFSEKSSVVIRWDFLILFMGLLVIADASLLWGHGFTADWKKHRSILLCLYGNPVNPGLEGFGFDRNPWLQGMRLVYYYGHYLPSVYLAKLIFFFVPDQNVGLLTWSLAFLFLLWSLVGMLLTSLLLPVACEGLLGRKKNGNVWGIFYLGLFAFTGLNFWCKHAGWVLGFLGYCTHWPLIQPLAVHMVERYDELFRSLPTWYTYDLHAEWWTPFFAQIAGFISDWQWTPQHLVSGLSAVVLLGVYRDRFHCFPLCLWSTFLLATSVFCWMGALPLAGLVFLYFVTPPQSSDVIRKTQRWMGQMKLELLGSAVSAGIILKFYNMVPIKKGIQTNRWLELQDGLERIFLFYLIEFLPAILILLGSWRWQKRNPSLPWACLFVAAVLSIFSLGGNNDLVLRGSMPAMLVLMMLCGYMIQEGWGNRTMRAVSLLFLLLVVPGCVNEFVMGLKAHSPVRESHPGVAAQYVTPLESLFSKPPRQPGTVPGR